MPAPRRFRFGDYLQETTIRYSEVSYNLLIASPGIQSTRLKLKPLDVHRLLAPYVSSRFLEQLRAVLPLALYMGVFQFAVLKQSISEALTITGGLLAVMIGLMFFMEGLKLGIMPFSEAIGNGLPRKSSMIGIMAIAFVLGVGVTFAEPAIGALQEAGKNVDVLKAPYLYTLLNDRSSMLVWVLGLSAGVSSLVGVMRFVFGWRLKTLVFAFLIPDLILTIAAAFHPELHKIIGLAWDCAGALAGPVTVPIVLALGIGVASSSGRQTTSLSGFGIVTLASLIPVTAVFLYGGYLAVTVTPESIIAGAQAASRVVASSSAHWYDATPGQEVVQALQAILPLLGFLFVVQKWVLRERLPHVGIIRYGIGLTVLGMILFNLGLTYGLTKLGDQSGGLIPAAFARQPQVLQSPLYGFLGGIAVVCTFTWFLGFGSTLAEPSVNAMAITVEDLTNGAFKKRLLRYSMAFGVAGGLMIGVLKVIFDFPLVYALVPSYLLAALMTAFSSEEMVNLAWDASGVTTGPVTVPLVLSMGLALGNSVGAVEGFGILAMAAVFAVFPILTAGLWVDRRVERASHG
jgi:hypothetical protein